LSLGSNGDLFTDAQVKYKIDSAVNECAALKITIPKKDSMPAQ
jgi:hypothetical protein